ncbi:MAG: hypothetical protein ISS57_15480 [Anaerolineales bacterium]|nr:hypothetical protein [Anaerolineales bacterium]
MDTLTMLGTFLNVVAIAFVVVCILIAVGLITAIIMLVKKVKPSGKGTRPTPKNVSPPKPRNRQLNRQSPNRSRFRTRRKLV